MKRFFVVCFLCGMLAGAEDVAADDSDETDDSSKVSLEDSVGQSMKGVGDWVKNAADEVKEKSEAGVGVMKEFSDQAREKSEAGFGAMKGLAEGIGERFSRAKERLEESGEKIKDAIGSAATKSKDEFESAASKVSKYAKEASDTMFGLLG